MNLYRSLKAHITNGFFYDEKLVGERTNIEQPVPEYPFWMKQPEAGKTSQAWFMKPVTIDNPRVADTVAIIVILAALASMPLLG